jgi:hypothetical protein
MKAEVTGAQSQRPQPIDNDRFAFILPEGAAAIPVRLKRVYCPSPKSPRRISPLNRPKANDARATIDGKRRVVDTSAGAAAKIRAPSGYS